MIRWSAVQGKNVKTVSGLVARSWVGYVRVTDGAHAIPFAGQLHEIMQTCVRALAVLATALLIAGCASSGAKKASRKTSSFAPITALEIQEVAHRRALDTYAIVRQLRPRWTLPGRRPIRVYLNGVDFGVPHSLTQVPPGAVREIRYVPVWQSTPYHSSPHDIILVLTH